MTTPPPREEWIQLEALTLRLDALEANGKAEACRVREVRQRTDSLFIQRRSKGDNGWRVGAVRLGLRGNASLLCEVLLWLDQKTHAHCKASAHDIRTFSRVHSLLSVIITARTAGLQSRYAHLNPQKRVKERLKSLS